MNVGATPERPYVCEHCNQAFSRQHNLKSHYFVHSGERPFKCETCQQAFTRHHDLKRHIRSIHTGLKPYQCPNCKRAFARLDALNRHLRVSGNAPCVGMNNPRKSYTKHKKGEKGKNTKANAEKNDKKTEGDNTNNKETNEEVSTEVSNVEISKNSDIPTNDNSEVVGIENEVNSPPAINETLENQASNEKEAPKRGKVNKVIPNNNNTMNESIQNKNDEIEDISNLRNNIVHGPKKTLLPPKSLKPPQRRNQKRKNNMNGNDNIEIVSTMIVPPNKINNKANIPYANNNNDAISVNVNNDNIDISDKGSKKRKITNNQSKNTNESEIIDLGTDMTDSSQFTIPVNDNIQPYTVTSNKIVSYSNQTINANNNSGQNESNLPTNAKAIKAILDRNEFLENQLKDFKNEFYNFKKVQERLEQMEFKIKELEREKGVLRDMLNEKDQQNIKMRNSILSTTSSPIHGNNSNSVSNSINNINSISSMSDVSNIANPINDMNNYNNSSNTNIGYLAPSNNDYNKNYNAYKENGNYNTSSFIPSQITDNSSQPAYTIESEKPMSNLQNQN